MSNKRQMRPAYHPSVPLDKQTELNKLISEQYRDKRQTWVRSMAVAPKGSYRRPRGNRR